MKRNQSYYRHQRRRTIKRKMDLLRHVGGQEYADAWTKGAPGRLAKGKTHCSCPLCRVKSSDYLSCRDQKRMAFVLDQDEDIKPSSC